MLRSVAQIEEELDELKERFQELEVERQLAEKDAANPRKRRIYDRYLTIQRMIEQLNEMGEGVGDAEGYALHIRGRSFQIHPETGVQEN